MNACKYCGCVFNGSPYISISVCLSLQCATCFCGDPSVYSCFWTEEEAIMKDSPDVKCYNIVWMWTSVLCINRYCSYRRSVIVRNELKNCV